VLLNDAVASSGAGTDRGPLLAVLARHGCADVAVCSGLIKGEIAAVQPRIRQQLLAVIGLAASVFLVSLVGGAPRRQASDRTSDRLPPLLLLALTGATFLLLAGGLATPMIETGGRFEPMTESLNYSVSALKTKFSRARISLADAEKYGVFPLDDRSLMLKLVQDRQSKGIRPRWEFRPPVERITHDVAPLVCGLDHEITVELDWAPGQDGVLVASGSKHAGYVLYVEDGRLSYEYSLVPWSERIVADSPPSFSPPSSRPSSPTRSRSAAKSRAGAPAGGKTL
jgi:hypothetical protein